MLLVQGIFRETGMLKTDAGYHLPNILSKEESNMAGDHVKQDQKLT